MKTIIRPYIEKEFDLIAGWWRESGSVPPCPGMMIEDGTFVVDLDDTPTMSLTVLLTQSKQMAYIEGYICRPGVKKEVRSEIGADLWNHCFEFAKARGYARVVCLAPNEKLASRYEDLGMTRTLSEIHSLAREL